MRIDKEFIDLLKEREKMQKLLDYQKENLPAKLSLTCPNCLREKREINQLYVMNNIIENSYQTIKIKCFNCVYHNTHVYKIK